MDDDACVLSSKKAVQSRCSWGPTMLGMRIDGETTVSKRFRSGVKPPWRVNGGKAGVCALLSLVGGLWCIPIGAVDG
jgi:hypothetical protein